MELWFNRSFHQLETRRRINSQIIYLIIKKTKTSRLMHILRLWVESLSSVLVSLKYEINDIVVSVFIQDLDKLAYISF